MTEFRGKWKVKTTIEILTIKSVEPRVSKNSGLGSVLVRFQERKGLASHYPRSPDGRWMGECIGCTALVKISSFPHPNEEKGMYLTIE